MRDDQLTSLNWLVQSSGGSLPMPTNPTPPSSPPPAPTQRPKGSSANIVTNNNNTQYDYKNDPVKPPHSYAQLITMAMQAHGGEKVVLLDIYQWITENFAFFRNGDNSWQNSIRHNLSLNKQFIKIPREPDDKGKGSYWMLDPRNKDPYCIRRRNFVETHSRRQRPQVSRPMVNPAIKSLMEKTRRMQEARRHPFCGSGERLEDIGAHECVYTDSNPGFDDYNQKLFKREVESFSAYLPQSELAAGGGRQPLPPLPLSSVTAVYSSSYSTGVGAPLLMAAPPVVTTPHCTLQQRNDGESHMAAGERVKVEFNWEGYEYHPSGVAGVQLPLQLSPNSVPSFAPTNTIQLDGTVGSVGLSPPNSEECSEVQAHTAGLDLRIPTPDWWRNQVTTASLLSPQTGFHNPLARVFENLNSSGSSIGSMKEHPWQDRPSPTVGGLMTVAQPPTTMTVLDAATVTTISSTATLVRPPTDMELFSLEPMQLPTTTTDTATGDDTSGTSSTSSPSPGEGSNVIVRVI